MRSMTTTAALWLLAGFVAQAEVARAAKSNYAKVPTAKRSFLSYLARQGFSRDIRKMVTQAIPAAGVGTPLSTYVDAFTSYEAKPKPAAELRWQALKRGCRVQNLFAFAPGKTNDTAVFCSSYGHGDHLIAGTVSKSAATIRTELAATHAFAKQVGLAGGQKVHLIEEVTIRPLNKGRYQTAKKFDVGYTVRVQSCATGAPLQIGKHGTSLSRNFTMNVEGSRGLNLVTLAKNEAEAGLYRSFVLAARNKVLEPKRALHHVTTFANTHTRVQLRVSERH